MLAKKKAKIFSNYAFKGITALVSIIYVVLFGMAFWQINSLNKKIENYDQVEKEHILKKKELDIVSKEYTLYKKSLDLGKSIKSNKKLSFRMLAQIASAVPKRVKFKSIKYEANKNSVLIEGSAYSDKDILKLISNLSAKKLIMQATLTSMTLPNSSQNSGQVMKGFKIICKLKRA
jgi:type IV pilus assembly protein PilN